MHYITPTFYEQQNTDTAKNTGQLVQWVSIRNISVSIHAYTKTAVFWTWNMYNLSSKTVEFHLNKFHYSSWISPTAMCSLYNMLLYMKHIIYIIINFFMTKLKNKVYTLYLPIPAVHFTTKNTKNTKQHIIY